MLEEPRRIPTEGPALQLVSGEVIPATSRRLWAVVILTDILALLAGWALPALAQCGAGCSRAELRLVGLALLMVPVTMAFLAISDAYGSGAWMLYSVEISRLNRAAIGSAAVFFLLQVSLTEQASPWPAIWRSALAAVVLAVFRGLRRRWVSVQRRDGRYITPVLLVGSGPESEELFHLFKDHPEIGYTVSGLIPSDRLLPTWCNGLRSFPSTESCASAARACGASVVLIDASAFDGAELEQTLAGLAGSGLQVRLAGGFDGWSRNSRRSVKAVPLAYESIYDVAPADLPRWQLGIKRVLDTVVGAGALVLCLPVLVVAALAVRIVDGSPVFIRQQRVGRFGRLFTMLKLRTMVVNAEARLPEVLPMNMRDGPLFKADADPRITPLGRFLRAASIDEIPQLLNVMRGDMSLVGPRPSLPDECMSFDGTLRLRERVPPGLSGLWQVEARDMPSFRAYRRLDLYYVQNWSLGLDLAILMVTPVVVAARAWRAVQRLLPGRRTSSALSLLD